MVAILWTTCAAHWAGFAALMFAMHWRSERESVKYGYAWVIAWASQIVAAIGWVTFIVGTM